MKLQKIAALLITIALPVFAYADINVVNNTGAAATGDLDFSPCSSSIGDRGIVSPGGSMSVSKGAIQTVCGDGSCEVNVYMSRNCSGKKIARLSVNKDRGAFNIRNYDGRYRLNGGGSNVSIDQS